MISIPSERIERLLTVSPPSISHVAKIMLLLAVLLLQCGNELRFRCEAFQLASQRPDHISTFPSHSQMQRYKLSKTNSDKELIFATKLQLFDRQQVAKIDKDYLFRMNKELEVTSIGELNPRHLDIPEIMNAWAKTRTTEGAEMVEMWLQRVRKEVEMGNQLIKLGADMYNIAIDAWATSGHKNAPLKAEQIVKEMEEMHKLGHNCQPTVHTYNLLIHSWEKSGVERSASQAEQIIAEMERKSCKPNINTYNLVMKALAKCDTPEHVEAILFDILERHNTNSVDEGGNDIVKPNTATFNSVIDAWACSSNSEAALRVERIVEMMEVLYESGNKDVQPNGSTYNSLINVLVKSGKRGSAARAEQILAKMESRFRAGGHNLKPNTVTYNIVINALANSSDPDSAERAERVLRNMLEHCQPSGDNGIEEVKPNVISFTSVINAWAKSGKRSAASRAEHILALLQEHSTEGKLDIKPDTQAYTAVIHACTSTKHEEDKNDALKIAFRVFKKMSSHDGIYPNEYTYAILLSACHQLLPMEDKETRFTIAKALFEKCREAGFVNDFVLNKLRKTVITTKNYIQLVGCFELRAINLPEYWTRNIHDGRSNEALVARKKSKRPCNAIS